jgi:exodeoxyribonuclease VII large subunit
VALPGTAPRVLTVTQLVQRLREALDARFPAAVWVAGELSNVHRAASGHLYFTLKDDESQLAAVMFRSAAQLLLFRPTDGLEVLVAARPGVYAARGTLQLYVEAMEPRGQGALRLAFEQLKARLAAEGLFAAERKRPLPRFPATVGIVTALGGAAIHDLRTVLSRRWPAARVLVRPVRVQGQGAAAEIAAAIADLNQVPGVAVLIVGRGGGSLEDLWAFNEEAVARAIAASHVPVVSAVGHEVDFTIADFVADARAPTPTAAAALVVPDRVEVAATLARAAEGLRAGLLRQVGAARERLGRLERGLGDPRRRVRDLGLRLDDLAARARGALGRRVGWERRELATLRERLLGRASPGARLGAAGERIAQTRARLERALTLRMEQARGSLAAREAALAALSPLACLARGYAIVRRGGATGPVVRDAAVLAAGEPIAVTFARGRARARVEATEREDG